MIIENSHILGYKFVNSQIEISKQMHIYIYIYIYRCTEQ